MTERLWQRVLILSPRVISKHPSQKVFYIKIWDDCRWSYSNRSRKKIMGCWHGFEGVSVTKWWMSFINVERFHLRIILIWYLIVLQKFGVEALPSLVEAREALWYEQRFHVVCGTRSKTFPTPPWQIVRVVGGKAPFIHLQYRPWQI